MRRVHRNVLRLLERLPAIGYRFTPPALGRAVHRDPTDEDHALLRRLEEQYGPVPLSVRAFYEVAGPVDFTQAYHQLVQWPEREEGQPYTPLEVLGELAPLAVSRLEFAARGLFER